jgi:hypothetical protein
MLSRIFRTVTTTLGGAHGGEFGRNDGSVHRFLRRHELLDMTCELCRSPDSDVYMVTDDLWASSGLTGRECLRCLQTAIGRELVSTDYQPGHPDNYGDCHNNPELQSELCTPNAGFDIYAPRRGRGCLRGRS